MKRPRISKSKDLRSQIKDYNAELEELPAGVKELQDRMLTGCGWQTGDGEFPGVFDDGRGVLWTVQWLCSGNRIIGPRDYWPLKYLPVEALIFEMLDYCTYETTIGRGSGRVMHYLKFMLDLKACEVGTKSVEGFMANWKPKLFGQKREYIFVPDPPEPDRVVQPHFRPGWPTKGWTLPPVMEQARVIPEWRVAP